MYIIQPASLSQGVTANKTAQANEGKPILEIYASIIAQFKAKHSGSS